MRKRTPKIDKLVARGKTARLVQLLQDDRTGVRTAASEALGRVGDLAAVESLERLLDTESYRSVINAAARALGELGNGGALALSRVMKGGGGSAAIAADVLCQPGRDYSEAITENLIAAATGGANGRARAKAIATLDHLEPPGVVQLLDQALADTSGDVRRAAVEAIGRRWSHRYPPSASDDAPPIEMPASDASSFADVSEGEVPAIVELRCEVASGNLGLAANRGSDAVELLTWFADRASSGPDLLKALDALATIEDARVYPYLEKQLHESAGQEGRDADTKKLIGLVRSAGEASAVEPLREILGAVRPDVAVVAIDALAQIGNADALDAVEEVLRTAHDPQLRIAAIHGLTGTGRALDAIEDVLGATRDPRVRIAAINGLAGTGRAVDTLIALLRDESPEVVASAASAVARAGHPDARTELKAALERIEQDLKPLERAWDSWKDWDQMEAYYDDDSPGHSTYKMDREKRDEVERAYSPLASAKAALETALEQLG